MAEELELLGSTAPDGLVGALRARQARVDEAWVEEHRHYAFATTPAGRIFVRFSADSVDIAVLAHEVEVRAIIGDGGELRCPPVLENGDGWLVEEAVDGEPSSGREFVAAALAAQERLVRVTLPEGVSQREPLRAKMRRRWLTLRSPLSIADVRQAHRIRRSTRLPVVTSHGDFHPRNLLFRHGALWIIDWELCGQRPAGSDLMQLWAMLTNEGDRAQLFDGAVDLIGEEWRSELLGLRYATVVGAIVGLVASRFARGKDSAWTDELLGLLPQVRADAGYR